MFVKRGLHNLLGGTDVAAEPHSPILEPEESSIETDDGLGGEKPGADGVGGVKKGDIQTPMIVLEERVKNGSHRMDQLKADLMRYKNEARGYFWLIIVVGLLGAGGKSYFYDPSAQEKYEQLLLTGLGKAEREMRAMEGRLERGHARIDADMKMGQREVKADIKEMKADIKETKAELERLVEKETNKIHDAIKGLGTRSFFF